MMAVNGTSDPGEEGAIVEWINTFPLTHPVQTLGELNDGQVLWQMLRDIDKDWFADDLPNNKQSTDASRQNLQFVYDHLQDRLQANGKNYDPCTQGDLDRMAADDSASDIVKAGSGSKNESQGRADGTKKLVRMILLAILDSPKLPKLLARIQELPEPTLQVIGSLMREMSDWAHETSHEKAHQLDSVHDARHESPNGATSPPVDLRAEVFQLEEQYAKTFAQLERRNRDYEMLEAEHQALGQSFAKSQETNNALKSQIYDYDEQVKRLTATSSQREQSSVRELESKISQLEELISGHEEEAARSHNAFLDLQRDNKKLLADSEMSQRLQDEFDAMKVELEKQTRRANTADKYMQKLQARHHVERERDAMRQELEEKNKRLIFLENVRLDNIALQKANDEVSRTLSQIEREDEELRKNNKQLRLNCDSYAQHIKVLDERNAQDQETIADLKDNQRSQTAPSSATGNSMLEYELSASSEQANDIVRRNKERMDQLTIDLRDQKAATAAKEEELQRRRQEIAALKLSVDKAQLKLPHESTEGLRGLREDLEDECTRLQEEVKTLRQENESLRSADILTKHKPAQDQQDLFEKRLDRAVKEKQLPKEQIADIIEAIAPSDDTTDIGYALIDLIVDTRAQTARQQEVIQRQENLIKDMRNQIQQQASYQESNNLSRGDRAYLQNVERESKLISTAFHDLAGRLQLNNVVLQRRAEAPKNWLSRQRRLLEGPVGLTR